MPIRTAKIPDPFEGLLEYEGFLSILKYYVDLNCFVIPLDSRGIWTAIYHHQRLESLFDFEKKYGFVRKWNQLTDSAFENKHQGKPLLVENLGFYDAFTPIRKKGTRLGTLLSGAFADRELTYRHLRESWNQLTGQAASPENPEFREFARVMLEIPVLESPALLAFQESLEIFARILTHEEHRNAQQRMRQLVVEVFCRHLPHSFWMGWALGLPTRQATPTWNLKLQELDWVRSEIGISRVPTTVITAIPVKASGRKSDPVEEMIRVYRFQRSSFTFARSLLQTVGGKLENYGAVFVTSPDPDKSRPQRRREVLERADRIHRFAVEMLEGPALVGIGETVTPGEPLNESYRQAVLALHLGRQSGKKLVFFSPSRDEKKEGLLKLRRLLLGLKRQFETASFSGMESVLDEFLREVLTLSFQNPEEIRWHLQYGLIHLVEATKSLSDLGEKEARAFYEGLALSLDNTGTTQEMILTFKEAVEKFLKLTQGKGALKEAYSIGKIRDYVTRHFAERLRISRLARMAKVSISTLSRRFKKTTGVGLETFLQNLRLEEARRLLKTGSLPVSQIAKACGFASSSYFIRLFRKKTGFSPQKFRQKSGRV
jgi:AraC-like DNA-binding protein